MVSPTNEYSDGNLLSMWAKKANEREYITPHEIAEFYSEEDEDAT